MSRDLKSLRDAIDSANAAAIHCAVARLLAQQAETAFEKATTERRAAEAESMEAEERLEGELQLLAEEPRPF